MAELSYNCVSNLIKADFETGQLVWLNRPVEMFKSKRAANVWNSKYAGKEAFTATCHYGYRVGRIHDRLYKAHRVIWLLAYCKWPADSIDHINGDKSDNRLVNIRAVTQSENCKNHKKSTRNTSGVTGVGWCKREKKWEVKIFTNWKNQFLGYYDDFDAAVARRKSAEIEKGFHPNHGR